jgi:uncharacterized integral membrane protein
MRFGEVPLKDQVKDNIFAAITCLIIFLSVFTGINSVVYNWVYLDKVYAKPYDKWSFARLDMFTGYWNWPVGKVMCLINVSIVVGILILWTVLHFKIKQKE